MYIYHALINALSAHMINIKINTIFYTYIEDSSTKTTYIRHYMETHTHTHTRTHARTHARRHTHTHTLTHSHTHTLTHTLTHTDCSRNWVLILAGAEIL